MCHLHYTRWRTGGPAPEVPVRPRVAGGKPCAVEGCGRKARAAGLCHSHYERQRIGLDAHRPLLTARVERTCPICSAPFSREKTLYCSRACAEESWARQKAAHVGSIRFFATRSPEELAQERGRLLLRGFRPGLRAQGATKPGLFTFQDSSGLLRLRWYNRVEAPSIVYRREIPTGKGERWRLVAATMEADPWADMAEIARRFGISRERVRQIAKEVGLARRIVSGPCEGCGRRGKTRRKCGGRLLCKSHASLFFRTGEVGVLHGDRYTSDTCSVEGCSAPRNSLGMCARHYANRRYATDADYRLRMQASTARYWERRVRGEVGNPLPRCFDCDRALRPKDRIDVVLGGDCETLCPACHAGRFGTPAVLPAVVAPSEGLFQEIERVVAKVREDLRDDVRQELYVEALSGNLKPGLVYERLRSIRRQAMVASSDRSFGFVSLDDRLGDGELTYGDRYDLFLER